MREHRTEAEMKLCLGCMKQVKDYHEPCPHCGFDLKSYRREAYYLKPGAVIAGKYVVGRALNYDGYVIAYIGWDMENSRRVAVSEYMASDFATRMDGDKKVAIYSGDAAAEYEKGLSVFLKEGNIRKNLSKVPGIAAVYDCRKENATGYLIEEYLEGRTLLEVMREGRRFTFAQTMQLLAPIFQGLCILHQAGVLHLGISPEHILLMPDKQVKLIHFGVVRYMSSSRSRSLAVMVRQGYAPEELYRSTGRKGSWSDVYSLAAVCYYMMTGIVPTESIERALHDTLKEPSEYHAEIPKPAENALMNALNVLAEDRTKTVKQFMAELKDSSVRRIQPKKKDSEKSWRAKKAVIAVLAALVILISGAAFFVTRSVYLERKASGVYMLSAAKLNDIYTKSGGEEAVREQLEALGFAEDKIDFVYEYSPDSSENMIFETKPLGQELLTEEVLRGNVTLSVASREYVSVSEDDMRRLEAMKVKSARQVLEKQYGFTHIIQVENENYDDGTAGTVYEIKGDFTGKTDCAQQVTVVCAKGSRQSYEKTVPDLTGVDFAQYKRKKEIRPIRENVYGTGWGDFKDGQIVYTNKKAGDTIVTGGPDSEEFICYVWNHTPDLSSLTEENVKSELNKVGISVVEGEPVYSDSIMQGKLIFDQTRLTANQKETVVYHKSLGKKPQPKNENQGGGNSSGSADGSNRGSSADGSSRGGSADGSNRSDSNGSSRGSNADGSSAGIGGSGGQTGGGADRTENNADEANQIPQDSDRPFEVWQKTN